MPRNVAEMNAAFRSRFDQPDDANAPRTPPWSVASKFSRNIPAPTTSMMRLWNEQMGRRSRRIAAVGCDNWKEDLTGCNGYTAIQPGKGTHDPRNRNFDAIWTLRPGILA